MVDASQLSDDAAADRVDFWEKIRIEASCPLEWDQNFPDGTPLSLPLVSVGIEVGYPDVIQPIRADGSPNLQFRASAFHFVPGHEDPTRPAESARWTRDNRDDVLRFEFRKLTSPAANWDPNEIIVRKTLVFDPSDPRVDLSTGNSQYVIEKRTTSHTLSISTEPICHIFVKMALMQTIPKGAVSIKLTLTLGDRRDVKVITGANQQNICMELFSDKYKDANLSYEMGVTVRGPKMTDLPITYHSPEPVAINLLPGNIRYSTGFVLELPTPPPDKVETISRYIQAFQP